MNTLACALALVAGSVASQASGVVNVDIYSGHGTAGGGAPFSGLVGSFTSPDVMFATDTGYAWHPLGLGDFGADITGCLDVASGYAGVLPFTLNSDDGSMLYIDGSLVIDNGGGHPPATAAGWAAVTAGHHTFEIQFYEDFGGESGVDLYLPAGVSYTSCPDGGSTLALLGGAFLLVGSLNRRFRA